MSTSMFTPEEEGAALKPPYMPYPTFRNFLAKLKETGVPHRIDKSVMTNLSGAAQSHLLSGLRFLGLIDAAGNPSKLMQDAVASLDTPKWETAAVEMLKPYVDIVGKLNLEKATPAQVQEAFRDQGRTEGTTTEKAIRFFLKMCDEGKMSYSNHFPKTRGPRVGTRRRRPAPQDIPPAVNHDAQKQDQQKKPEVPDGMMSFPIHLPGKPAGSIIVPKDIDNSDVDLINAAIEYIKIYAKRNSPATK